MPAPLAQCHPLSGACSVGSVLFSFWCLLRWLGAVLFLVPAPLMLARCRPFWCLLCWLRAVIFLVLALLAPCCPFSGACSVGLVLSSFWCLLCKLSACSIKGVDRRGGGIAPPPPPPTPLIQPGHEKIMHAWATSNTLVRFL